MAHWPTARKEFPGTEVLLLTVLRFKVRRLASFGEGMSGESWGVVKKSQLREAW